MANVWFIVMLVVVNAFGRTEGLHCKFCSESHYRGEPSNREICFDSPSTVVNATCYGESQYCRTEVRLLNGVLYYAGRRCISSKSDHDSRSNAMPDSAQCQFTGSYTACYYSCNQTVCNIQPTRLMKQCSSDCNLAKSQGKCDYITGKCVCNPGVQGVDCSIVTAKGSTIEKSCVQCNEEMDPNCAKGAAELPAATSCPAADYKYCLVRKSSLLNENGEVVRSLISRTSKNDASYCRIIDLSDAYLRGIYKAYTCSETCNTNNCNTGIPSESRTPLRCVQCTDTLVDGICSTKTTATTCPAESKYCYATVVYLASPTRYTGYPAENRKLSVKRGCSVDKIKSTGCVTTTVPGTELKKVSCYESCTTSGCNTGWPARPKCFQCSASHAPSGYYAYHASCFSPQSLGALKCSTPEHSHCFFSTKKVSGGNGVALVIQRGCALDSVTENCNETTIEGVTAKVCYKSYNTTGCNTGSRNNVGLYPILFTILVASKLFTFM